MSNQTSTDQSIGLIALSIGLGCGFILLVPFIFFMLVFATVIPSIGQYLEGSLNISKLSKGQEDYFFINNRFTSQISDLNLDIKSETNNYSYRINVVDPEKSVKITAKAKKKELSSYTSAVFAIKADSKNQQNTLTKICWSKVDSLNPPEMPKLIGNKAQCSPGSNSFSLTEEP
ncbi:MAG: type IV pilin-like G/H family protein [Mastigocoleus sp.]